MMKVSILIPLFNAEKFVAKAIQSAIDQTWEDIEVIVVDDGSTDNSLNIAKNFESDRIKVFHQYNQGGCAARNVAFGKSSGDYIQYLDADDYLDKDKIRYQMEFLRQYNYDKDTLVYGHYWHIYGSDFEQKKCPMHDLFIDYIPAYRSLVNIWLNSFNSFQYSAFLIKREKITETGLWNVELKRSQDSEFMARVISNSTKMLFCKDSIHYYREIPYSISRASMTEKQLLSELLVSNITTDIILDKSKDSDAMLACSKRYTEFLTKYYPENKSYIKEVQKIMKNKGLYLYFKNRGKTFKLLNLLFGWKLATQFIKHKINLKKIK